MSQAVGSAAKPLPYMVNTEGAQPHFDVGDLVNQVDFLNTFPFGRSPLQHTASMSKRRKPKDTYCCG
jgi:hypothetical protein